MDIPKIISIILLYLITTGIISLIHGEWIGCFSLKDNITEFIRVWIKLQLFIIGVLISSTILVILIHFAIR